MINDYPELVAEVTERSGHTDVVNRAGMYVGMAEDMLSKRLRLSGMLSEVTLTTDSTGSVALPADYREMQLVLVSGCKLEKLPLADFNKGSSTGYVVFKGALRSYYKSTAHAVTYFASVPGLETANTSWLLTDEPELYLQAVLFQVYTGKNEIEKAQVTAGYLATLIDNANTADFVARRSGTRIRVGGHTP